MEDYLYHYGVKHMKWGRRRYQNKDGSLTPAGKERYNRDIRDNKRKKSKDRIEIDGPDVDRWVKQDIERSRNVANSASTMSNDAKRVANLMMPSSNKTRKDYSNLSDKEMRERINRELLERQYDSIFNSDRSSAKAKTMSFLEDLGAITGLVASGLGITLAVKELMGK